MDNFLALPPPILVVCFEGATDEAVTVTAPHHTQPLR
jgi:hypothetical protein